MPASGMLSIPRSPAVVVGSCTTTSSVVISSVVASVVVSSVVASVVHASVVISYVVA